MDTLVEIFTERCVLRLPIKNDAVVMRDFVIKNKEYLAPFEPLKDDDYFTEEYWQTAIAKINDDFINDKSCCLNLYFKGTNELIGMINYNHFVRGAFHSCFLGFKLAYSMQRKGLMTEALKASFTYVFETLNLHRISANYMPHNIASAKVLAKCRFKEEGLAEKYLYINGKWENHILASLINDKWQKV